MLNTKYNHLDVEKSKYNNWLNKGYFKSGDITKEPFTIVIPPPNITGKLHLGHAWDTTIQDALIRYKRMDGFDALWVPGMDHAGIATQAKVDEKLRNLNINPRSISREKWLKYAWDWKEEYAQNIRNQWSKLGLSLNYDKERFTIDDGLVKAVNKAFISLYNKGIIYRGTRAINWDPVQQTALSNVEVIHKETRSTMYYFKYMITGTEEFIEVATTRPETLASDRALVVHPSDERYKTLVGKTVITPLIKMEIPIITDSYIDMEFGSGAMKCSAHATTDVEILKKHNLDVVECINLDGFLNENALEFCGMTRKKARTSIVEKLNKENLLIKREEIINQVGYSERSNAVIETIVMPQWFVKMENLAKNTLDNQKTENKVAFHPDRFENIFNGWMENIQDWCISRQLWWGHRIPAWYKENKIKVQVESPGNGWTQDEDVLDTWFSSSLWPFSTLGFPNENSDDLNRYFPNDVLITGNDILFFWVSRMIFTSLELTEKRPFNNVLLHGIIRDKNGIKMSKSLGNGIDPIDMIEKYGADSLRTFLISTATKGQDLKFDEEKVKSTWNFINKLWNASRFVLMNLENFEYKHISQIKLDKKDKWILHNLNNTILEVRKNLDSYDFNLAYAQITDFVWNKYCSYYIELSKNSLDTNTLNVHTFVIKSILKLLHPFMPYVTEEIYAFLPNSKESIMISAFPKYSDNFIFTIENEEVSNLIDFITLVRNRKLELKITYVKKTVLDVPNYFNDLIKTILKIEETDANQDNLNNTEIEYKNFKINYFYDSSASDKEEVKILNKEYESLIASISKREKLLSNENYVNKAPKHVVSIDREKLKEEKERLELISSKLSK
ncbi:MAG: valine--tRNA ligase [Bacilli bacterium]